MTFDTLRLGLRWTFWALLWLMTALLGALLFLGTVDAPAAARWVGFAAVLGIIGEDVRRKLVPATEKSRH